MFGHWDHEGIAGVLRWLRRLLMVLLSLAGSLKKLPAGRMSLPSELPSFPTKVNIDDENDVFGNDEGEDLREWLNELLGKIMDQENWNEEATLRNEMVQPIDDLVARVLALAEQEVEEEKKAETQITLQAMAPTENQWTSEDGSPPIENITEIVAQNSLSGWLNWMGGEQSH